METRPLLSTVLVLSGLGMSLLLGACGETDPDVENQTEDENEASDQGTGGSFVDVPASGPIPEEVMPTAVGRAVCDLIERCSCGWNDNAGCVDDNICPSDYEDCVQQYRDRYSAANTKVTGIGSIGYRPEKGRECVSMMETADCAEADFTNTCTIMWQGEVALGGSCTDYLQCAGDKTDCLDGVCVEKVSPSLMAEGEACSSRSQCESGLACREATCQPVLARGVTCTFETANDPCGDGDYCNSQTSVCEPRVSHGSQCVFSEQCLDGECIDDICYAHDGICQPGRF